MDNINNITIGNNVANLRGLIGKQACLVNKDHEPYGQFFECVGYGVDPDSGEPTVFLWNTSNGIIFERVLSAVRFKVEEKEIVSND